MFCLLYSPNPPATSGTLILLEAEFGRAMLRDGQGASGDGGHFSQFLATISFCLVVSPPQMEMVWKFLQRAHYRPFMSNDTR